MLAASHASSEEEPFRKRTNQGGTKPNNTEHNNIEHRMGVSIRQFDLREGRCGCCYSGIVSDYSREEMLTGPGVRENFNR